MKIQPIKAVYKPAYRNKGYTFVSERRTDAHIRAELLWRLAYSTLPIEQIIAIATMQLALYWCNGLHDEARKRYDEAQAYVIDYANNFGYNINLELARAQNKAFEACSLIA